MILKKEAGGGGGKKEAERAGGQGSNAAIGCPFLYLPRKETS